MGVQLVMGEIDRCRVDDDIDRPRPGRGIDLDGAGRFLERASPGG
jgi:hypothetical protein